MLFLLFLGNTLGMHAQYAESIRSGRAGLAIGPYTVGKGVLQNQSGFYNTHTENISTTSEITDGEYFISVFRAGLTEHFELGAAFSYADYRKDYEGLSPDEKVSTRQEGINVFTLAMRVNVYEGDGLKPAFGYQINLGLPLVSEEFKADYVAPRITLLTAQKFGKFRFITNWAGIWSGNGAEPSAMYMLFLDRGFGKKVRIFFEHYGIMRYDNSWTPKFDGGFLYLVNNDIQLDFQYGNGPVYKNTTHDYFFSIGFAWRARLMKRS